MCLLQGLCFEHVLYPWRHAFLVFITSEEAFFAPKDLCIFFFVTYGLIAVTYLL